MFVERYPPPQRKSNDDPGPSGHDMACWALMVFVPVILIVLLNVIGHWLK